MKDASNLAGRLDSRATEKPLVVVMGVSGSGKSTIGAALAIRLRVPFKDGDDLQPSENIVRMHSGIPLDDEARWPWLDDVGRWLAAHARHGGIVACSALKRSYRDRLRSHVPDVWFLALAGDKKLIARRLAERKTHFMPPKLLSSQFAALEPIASDERGLTVDINKTTHEIIEAATAALTERRSPT